MQPSRSVNGWLFVFVFARWFVCVPGGLDVDLEVF